MIENYKGWDITLTWDDRHSFMKNSLIKDTFNQKEKWKGVNLNGNSCLLYTSPSPRDGLLSRMPSSA